MGALIKNEYIKIFSKTKTWLILGLIILSHIMISALYFKTGQQNLASVKNNLSSELASNIKYKNELESKLKSNNIDPEEVLKKDGTGFNQGIPKESDNVEINYFHFMKRHNESKAEFDKLNKLKSEAEFDLYNYQKKMSYLLTEDTSEFKVPFPEIIEHRKSVASVIKENIENKQPDFDTGKTALGYLMMYSDFMGMTGFWIVILALLISDIVSTEYQPPTLKTLLTQNKSRVQILLSKIFVSVTMAVISFIIITSLVYFVLSLFAGPGYLNHKMIFNQQFKQMTQGGAFYSVPIPDTGIVMTIAQFLVVATVQLLLFSFAMAGFMVLFSTITRNPFISLVFTVIIPMISIIVGQVALGRSTLSIYNPFIYGHFKGFSMNPFSLSSYFASQSGGASYNFPISMIYLTIFGFVCFTISLVNFKKRDQLV